MESSEAKWIRLERTPFEGKTSRWNVFTKRGVTPLGRVMWWNAWRKYCFFPLSDTLYEQDCLRDIADFCEQQTAERKRPKAAHTPRNAIGDG
jgi:hypothetical protein